MAQVVGLRFHVPEGGSAQSVELHRKIGLLVQFGYLLVELLARIRRRIRIVLGMKQVLRIVSDSGHTR